MTASYRRCSGIASPQNHPTLENAPTPRGVEALAAPHPARTVEALPPPAMVLYTAKIAFGERDPRRFHILPPAALAGTSDANEEQLRSAYLHLEAAHRAPCELGKTPLILHRMTVLGIANDLNYIVKAFAIANYRPGGHAGQLLLLPPAHAPHQGRSAGNNRKSLVEGRSMDNAWHWLDGLPGAKLDSIFTPSACQLRLQQPDEIGRLRALDAASRNASFSGAAQALGLGKHAFDAASAIQAIGKGLTFAYVPEQFRKHGMLWWFQALTTYLLRVRGPLAAQLQRHPAMQALAGRLAVGGSGSTAMQRAWLASSEAALRSAVRRDSSQELGWFPSVTFDAALHVRMGDACGPRAKRNQGIVRKCVPTLRAGLAPLLAHGVVPRGGRLFLATDSQSIVDEAAAAAATLPFEVFYLNISRAKYDSEAWIELNSAKDRTKGSILEETMLDLLLLSRARYIAGSMYGNMPRVALQLRPTAPGDARRLAWVTTDGRDWCTKPTCMTNNTPTGRYW